MSVYEQALVWTSFSLLSVCLCDHLDVFCSSVCVHHSVCSCEHVSYGHGKEATHLCVCVLLVGVLQMESSLSLCLNVSVCGTVTKPPFTWEQMTGSGFSVPSAKGNKI